MTDLTDLAACFIKQLCRERAATDTCAISLEDSIYLTDIPGRNPQSRTTSGTDRVRGSHEWIRTEVYIQHRTLSAFRQDRLAFLQIVIDDMLAINQFELFEVVQGLQPLSLHLGYIIFIVQ